MIVITGATGNTGHIIAQKLLKAGKQVRAITRSADKAKALADAGAEIAVGDLEDASFVKQAFAGAEAAYLLVPPTWVAEDWKAYQRSVNKNLVEALATSSVKYVVLLSSQGAHRPDAGPVSALGELEQQVKNLPGVNARFLRAGFFFQNFYGWMGMIQHMNMLGTAAQPGTKISMVHTDDIAAKAVKFLKDLSWSGQEVVFVPGAGDYTMAEAASEIGKAIGKPELPYVPFSYEDAKQGMMGQGIKQTYAEGYSELFKCMNEGHYYDDFTRTPENTAGKTLEQFATQEFAPAYKAGV